MCPVGRLVFLDLETAGPEPKRHPIIQLAAIAVDADSLASVESFEVKILFDEQKANKYSLRKNSYSRRTWQDEALPEKEAAHQFAAFLRRHATVPTIGQGGKEYLLAQLAAHHAQFDGSFLHAWYDRLGLFCPARFQPRCTMQRALWHFFEHPSDNPPVDYKLRTLCKYFGVPLIDAHDALGDVKATVRLYRAIVVASTPFQKQQAARAA